MNLFQQRGPHFPRDGSTSTLRVKSFEGTESQFSFKPHTSEAVVSLSTRDITPSELPMTRPSGHDLRENDDKESAGAARLSAGVSSRLELVQRSRHADFRRNRPMLGSKPDIPTQTNKASSSSILEAPNAARSTHIPTTLQLHRQHFLKPIAHDGYYHERSAAAYEETSPPFVPEPLKQEDDHHRKSEVYASTPARMRRVFAPEPRNDPGPLRPVSRLLRNSAAPSALSRSSSIATFRDKGDDDISALMMRGATDLRSAKFELEEQRREIERLNTRLEAINEEKVQLSQRLETTKQSTKKTLNSQSRSLDDLQGTIKTLENQSQEYFEFASGLRSSLPDLAELRKTISASLKAIEPMLDEDAQLTRSYEFKCIVSELQSENVKARQVNDLLRDKLESLGAELLDTKARAQELEASQSHDREALRLSANDLNRTVTRVVELNDALKSQQSEVIDALLSAANNEAFSNELQQQIQQLNEALKDRDIRLEEAAHLHHQISELQVQVHNYEEQLKPLESLRKELQSATDAFHEKESELGILQTSYASQESDRDALKARMSLMEEDLNEKTRFIQEISQDKIIAATKLEHITIDRANLQCRLADLEERLLNKDNELKVSNERAQQMEGRYQVLQERFDDQSVTLRITKEYNGDLQERLIAAEATYARKLEAGTGTLKCEIGVLQERRAVAETKLEESKDEIKRLRAKAEHTTTKISELEKRLIETQENSNSRLQQEVLRAERAENNSLEAEKRDVSLQEEIGTLKASIYELENEVKETSLLSPDLQAKIESLGFELDLVRSTKDRLEERARTISRRYKTGDMNDDEKAFVSTLIQTTQSIHEQELVTKGNELRRRENTIKGLQSRVNLLESTLARHLNSEAKAKAGAGAETHSMIDLDKWLSSQLSSSPRQAPDRDPPSVNDNTTGEHRPTSASGLPSSRIIASPFPHACTTPTRTTPVHYTLAPDLAVAGVDRRLAELAPMNPPSDNMGITPARTAFARLATEASDDILDFDDDQRLTPSTNLGKRGRECVPSPPDNVEVKEASRPNRRAKVATRRSARQVDQGNASSKPNEPAPRAKTRKRR